MARPLTYPQRRSIVFSDAVAQKLDALAADRRIPVGLLLRNLVEDGLAAQTEGTGA